MKTVFSDISTIAHMWANKTQSKAGNGRNFFYEGDIIYSYGYHFPIAKHVEFNGEKAVLFTLQTYSNTTAKHIHVVRQACRHLNVIYCYSINNDHLPNIEWWITQAEYKGGKLLNARKPEIYLNQLSQLRNEAQRYCNFFDLPMPIALERALNIQDKEQYSKYIEEQVAFIAAAKKEEEKQLKKKHKAALAKWLAGETNRLYVHDGFDYLRMSADNSEVETTQGVKVPYKAALFFYNKIKDGSLKVGDKLEDWTVNEVGKEIQIGCHTFKTDYLLKFGKNNFQN